MNSVLLALGILALSATAKPSNSQLIKQKYEETCVENTYAACQYYPQGSQAKDYCLTQAAKFAKYCNMNILPKSI